MYSISRKRDADYNNIFAAPFCASVGSECSSMELLNGRGIMQGGNESNDSNTIDDCSDGNYGIFHRDESIDKIVVRSGDMDGLGQGLDLEAGKNATIVATIYAYDDGSEDYADFYFASNASSPEWQYLGTLQPPGGGVQDLMMVYVIPDGEVQAASVSFRHMGNASSCTEGGFNERDDLVFTVVASTEASSQPSTSPSSSEIQSVSPV